MICVLKNKGADLRAESSLISIAFLPAKKSHTSENVCQNSREHGGALELINFGTQVFERLGQREATPRATCLPINDGTRKKVTPRESQVQNSF